VSCRYFIRVGENPWIEVSVADFAEAERSCGFYNKTGATTATAGFGKGNIQGRVESDIPPLIGLGEAKVEGAE